MTEDNVEGGQAAQEQAGSMPEPQFASGAEAGAKHPSQGTTTPTADFETLLPVIEELIDRRVQSAKDRRWSRLERQYGELGAIQDALAEYQELIEGGLSKEAARDRLVLQQLEKRAAAAEAAQRLTQQPGSVTGQTGGTGLDWKAAIDPILRDAGIAENDPELAELMRGKVYTDVAALTRDVAQLALRRARRPQPNPASAAGPQGGGGRTPDEVEVLRQQYNEKLARIRRGDVGTFHKLQAEYRKKGLNI